MIQKKREFIEGLRDGLPVSLGYLPYGIAYGLLAKQAGLNIFQTLLMSAFVYAGTSQFIAVALIEVHQTALAISLAAVVVNLRYLLMNSALAEAMKGWRLSFNSWTGT